MKDQLLQFIDAFGAARATQNQILVNMATTALRSFLDSVEVRPARADAEAEDTAEQPAPDATEDALEAEACSAAVCDSAQAS